MQTQAAVLSGPGLSSLSVEAVTVDAPGDHEVLVRVMAAGLCHSDLHIIEGRLPSGGPRILGHEIAGVVQEVGSAVSSLTPGEHVVACLAMSCGHCDACIAEQPNLCIQRSSLWARPPGSKPRVTSNSGDEIVAGSGIGGLAEYALVHERGLVAIPDWMPMAPAALMGCAVITGTGAVFRAAAVRPGTTVAVIGCGGVGLSAIQAARISGATLVVAVDRSPRKLDVAGKLGATATVLAVPGETGHVDAVRQLTGGRGVDYAFEAVGSTSTVEDALAMLGRRGTATIIGVFPAGVHVSVPARDMLVGEKRLQGSYMGSSAFRRDVPELCDYYAAGMLRLDEMIDPVIGLDEVRVGFERLASGESLRPLVIFPGLQPYGVPR